MNTTKQFWALFKFQTVINPTVWFMALAYSANSWTPLLIGYQPSLSFSISNISLIFTGLLCVTVISPDIFSNPIQNVRGGASGVEFLLTRATDRKIVYRSKAAFLYLLVLVVPLILLCVPAKEHVFKTDEYSKIFREECLNKLPGTTLLKAKYGEATELAIPNGKLLISSWQIWSSLLVAIISQICLWICLKVTYLMRRITYLMRRWQYLLWGLYPILLFVIVFTILVSPSNHAELSFFEKLFFLFAPHQLLGWFCVAIALIFAELLCEYLFVRMEQ